MHFFKAYKPHVNPMPGILSLNSSAMAPDGKKYLFFWAPHWQLSSGLVEGKKNSDEYDFKRDHIMALTSSYDVLGVFPNSQVKGWVSAEMPPPLDCYLFKRDYGDKLFI